MDELYKENAKIVYHFLFSLCHDKQLAQDLTQDTFLKAIQSIERYDGSCKVSVWLCQIAKHLLYQHWQKHKREIPSEFSPEEQPAGNTDIEQQITTKYELLDVLKDMQKLPQQIREVMYLRVTGTLSFKEIGEIMGRSENWARVNFYRGKETLLKGRDKQ